MSAPSKFQRQPQVFFKDRVALLDQYRIITADALGKG
jgi:hypothetical protein